LREERQFARQARAMEEVAESTTDPDEKKAAGEWVLWAKVRADELDPLRRKTGGV